jgi:catechol 2,3-dioxygenase-like lactoylglutathione lyase family enzyme
MKTSVVTFLSLAGLAVCSPFAGQDVCAAEAPPRLLGISHLALKVADLEKSCAFYRDFLGFAEQYRLNDTNGAPQMVAFKVSDEQWLELFAGLQPGENFLYQIAFRVGNAEAMRTYLAGRGVKVPAAVRKGRIQNLNFSIKDPHGLTIEFVQYEPDGWTVRDQGKFLPETRISRRITHAGISVQDVPAAQKFYCDTLGMKEGWRGSRDGQVLSFLHVTIPESGDYLEYMLTPEKLPTRDLAAHFCLQVPDMPKAKALLDQRPYRKDYPRPVEIIIGKNNRRILNLYDPDGVRVELMEPNTLDGKPVPSSAAPLPTPKT